MAAGKPISILSSLQKLNKILIADSKDIGVVYMFAILAGMVQLSLPLGIQSIISFVMAGSLSTSIVVLIGMVVFGVFINGLLQIRQQQIIEKVKQKLFVRYSLEYSDRLPKLNIEKLDREHLPELVNRYFDSVSLQKGLDKLLLDLPAAIIQVILGLVLLAFYHPIFIAFGLVLILLVALVIRFTSANGLLTALNASNFKYGVAAWLQEVARTVKSFKYTKGTSLHMHQTDGLLANYLDSRNRYFKILLSQFWSLISFKIIITAAMLIIGSYLLVNQQINVGQFIAADIVIIAIIGSIEKLINNLDTMYEALVSVEKLSVITDAETEEGGTYYLAAVKQGVTVTFNNVSFAYSDQIAILDQLSFHVKSGELVQLNGPSGAGKSTVLRLLTKAFTNYSGNILIDDIPIGNYQLESLRSQTGILSGNQDIFYGSLWNNLTMGDALADMDEITKLTVLTGLDAFVHSGKNGYDTMLQPVGNKLSSNVRKNILLIRAIAGNYRLLLLEEPFEHLSEPFRNNVINYIKGKKDATVIIASADNRLQDYCDKQIFLKKVINSSNS